MEVQTEVRRTLAKSQRIHLGLSALTVNSEQYKSAVDFTIQVESDWIFVILSFC